MATMMASARSCCFSCSFCTSHKPVLTAKDYFDGLPPATLLRIMHLWNLYWIGHRDGRYSEADWEILAEKARSIGSCFFRMVLKLRTVSAESEEIFVAMITKFHFMLACRRQELVENGLHLENPFHPISQQYGEALEVKMAEWREYNMLTEAVISLPSRMMIRRCLSQANVVLMETFEYAMQSWHKLGEDRIDNLTKMWIWNDHMLKSGQMSDPAALAEEEVMVGLAAPSQLMICAATEEDIVMEEYSSPNSCASASMAILRDSAYGSDVNEGSSVSSSPSASSNDSASSSQSFTFVAGKAHDRENDQEGSDSSRTFGSMSLTENLVVYEVDDKERVESSVEFIQPAPEKSSSKDISVDVHLSVELAREDVASSGSPLERSGNLVENKSRFDAEDLSVDHAKVPLMDAILVCQEAETRDKLSASGSSPLVDGSKIRPPSRTFGRSLSRESDRISMLSSRPASAMEMFVRAYKEDDKDNGSVLGSAKVKNGGKRGRVLRCFRALFRSMTVCVKGPSTEE